MNRSYFAIFVTIHLAKDARKYRITTAIGKRNNTKDFDSYKLYLSDTGLFVTLMFIDRPVTENDIYAKLLSDKLPTNLEYLYENLVAQMITASGRELYYRTWEKKREYALL